MNQKNKKFIILFAGIIVIIIIFIGFVFFQGPKQEINTPIQSQSQSTVHTNQVSHIKNNVTPVIATSPLASPKTAALNFYTYYFSTPQNPLANGLYKTSPYLSPEFKTVVGALYDNGNAPVFCAQNKENKVVVDKEEQVSYNHSYLMQEVISEPPPSTKDLYMMLLENVNGEWLIFDINCIQ